MYSVNQVRHSIVGNSASTTTSVAAFKSAAVANSVLVCAADGKVYTTAQKQIAIKQYNDKGLISSSEVIDVDKITYIKALGYLPASAGVVSIAPGTVAASSYYEMKITFNNWGSVSAEDQYFRIAGYTTAASGDDQENVVDGLIQEMARTLSNEQPSYGGTFTYTLKGGGTVVLPSNPYFTFTKTGSTITAALVLTEKAQDYITGKKAARPLVFKAIINSDSADAVSTYTNASKGMGAGKDIKDLEYFTKGYTTDIYRGMGYPDNFETTYVADVTKGYNIVEIGYHYSGDGVNVQRSEKALTIAILSTDQANFAQYIVDRLATMTGKSVIAPATSTATLAGASVTLTSVTTAKTVTFYPTGATYTILSTLPSWANESSGTAFSSNVLTIDPTANTGATRSTTISIGSGGTVFNILLTQLTA